MKYMVTVLLILVIVLGYFTFKFYSESKANLKVIKQNELAFNDEMRKINANWVVKYAFVDDLNKEKDSLLKAKDETILNKSKVIIQLNKIISSGSGVVVEDSTASGKVYKFTASNIFYNYDLTVWTNPIYHELRERFNPFPLTVYLTENKEGVWSGYGEVDKRFQKYISIGDIDVRADKYEYAKVTEGTDRIDVGLGGSILIAPEVYLGVGASLMVDLTHEFSYNYYLGKSWHEGAYKWFFNFKKWHKNDVKVYK